MTLAARATSPVGTAGGAVPVHKTSRLRQGGVTGIVTGSRTRADVFREGKRSVPARLLLIVCVLSRRGGLLLSRRGHAAFEVFDLVAGGSSAARGLRSARRLRVVRLS